MLPQLLYIPSCSIPWALVLVLSTSNAVPPFPAYRTRRGDVWETTGLDLLSLTREELRLMMILLDYYPESLVLSD